MSKPRPEHIREVRRHPQVAANRLREVSRKLREDELPVWRRQHFEEVAKSLGAALFAAKRCRDCGLPLSDPTSVRNGRGPDCQRKDGAA